MVSNHVTFLGAWTLDRKDDEFGSRSSTATGCFLGIIGKVVVFGSMFLVLEWIGGNMKQEMLQIPLTSLRTFQKGGSALLESLFVSMWWDLLHQRQSLSALGAIGLLQWPAFYAFYHVRQICRSGVRGALSSPGH